jgi:hypothetical protein
MSIDSIFDDVIEECAVKPPIAILKELANALARKTKGLLVGKIEQTTFSDDSKDEFILRFYITVPSLNNYRYEVFNITHDIDFYPLKIESSNGELSGKDKTPEELENTLKEIFLLSQIKKVINGLLAQIKAA